MSYTLEKIISAIVANESKTITVDQALIKEVKSMGGPNKFIEYLERETKIPFISAETDNGIMDQYSKTTLRFLNDVEIVLVFHYI